MSGVSLYFLDQFVASAEHLGSVVKKDPSSSYDQLWLFLATARSGNPDAASARLREARALLPKDQWPAPVIDFFLGSIDAKAALDASSAADPRKKLEQSCEAAVYLAEHYLIRDEVSAALPLISSAFSSCPQDYVEYDAAIAEMARLQGALRTGGTPPQAAKGS